MHDAARFAIAFLSSRRARKCFEQHPFQYLDPTGKKSIERVIQQVAVELKAYTIRILDRNANSESNDATQELADDDVPL